MLLTPFLSTLLDSGQVTLAGQLAPFTAEDIASSTELLSAYYEEEVLEAPFEAPPFIPEAAIWGAQFMYRSIQFVMLRDLEDNLIQKELRPFIGLVTPAVIFSVDLCMRYLPHLFSLAKGLAPDDILVKYLKDAATQWPFSSVGIDISLSNSEHDLMMKHPALCQIYLDRILAIGDLKRVRDFQLSPWIKALVGEYPDQLLPKAFNQILNEESNTAN